MTISMNYYYLHIPISSMVTIADECFMALTVGGGIRIDPTEALTGHNLQEDAKGAVKQTYGLIKPGTIDPNRWWWD